MNIAILSGELTTDPRIVELSNGLVANFELRTVQWHVDKSQVRHEHTDEFSISCWNTLSQEAKHLHKGSIVLIVGRMEWRKKKDRTGAKALAIVASKLELIDGAT